MSYPYLTSQMDVNLDFENDSGFGTDSLTLETSIKKAKEHFLDPISRQTKSPGVRFNQLKHEWIEATKFLSSISEICMHPAYQSIIGMGKTAVPFIIQDMIESPNHWFWALKSITGEDPVPPSMRGKIKEMTNEWANWWFKKRIMDEW